MDDFEKIVVLLWVALLLVGLSEKYRIPYPITLVVGGGLLSFIPGLDFTYFDPNLILVIVLPPILYYSAFWTSYREFKSNFKTIFSLALMLVVITTLIIGVLFKLCFPDYPWAIAFAFGAIVSPPDASSATAILKRFSIPSRLVAILEGESLVNDASALVLYKLATIALLSGTFSLMQASFTFIQITAGGIAVGAIMGYSIQTFSRRYLNPVIGTITSFLIPYITFIVADLLQVSGVLAVVVNGLIGSQIITRHQSSLRRVLGYTTWDLFIITLNCFIFILIGSQLDEMTERMSWIEVGISCLYALAIWIAMTLVRMTWVYIKSGAIFMRADTKRSSQILREGTIVGWAGMRGIVSLTAALALPLEYANGELIAGRSHVIFITFMVIMFSLVLPALTLPKLIAWLDIQQKSNHDVAKEVRVWLAKVAQNEISDLLKRNHVDDEEANFLATYFQARSRVWEIASPHDPAHHKLESARRKVIIQQRKMLLQMWEKGDLDDDLLRLLERELDLEETSLAKAEI